jgi:hypothetical protein
MFIYIVQGTTGEYSDRTDWIVCAYISRELAEERASKAMRRATELKRTEWEYSGTIMQNEFDANMRMDYTGTEYTVEETELIER